MPRPRGKGSRKKTVATITFKKTRSSDAAHTSSPRPSVVDSSSTKKRPPPAQVSYTPEKSPAVSSRKRARQPARDSSSRSPPSKRNTISSPLSQCNSQQSTSSSSSGGRSNALAIMNPSAIQPSMTADELIKKLKTVSSEFQCMKQQEEEGDYNELVPFCLHLADEDFLNYSNRDVRLWIACCLADIFRIYAPETPFKEQSQLKTIFKFLISQLEGLKNVQGISFTRYYYLLENLAFVKCFTLCFEIGDEDAQEIFIALFEAIFSTINDKHTEKVRCVMADLLAPLLIDCPTISYELLDVILKQLLEPIKSSRNVAYQLANELLIRCSEALENYIESLMNVILVGNLEDRQSLHVADRIYDLIYELHTTISPPILQAILPQLEHKLKSLEEEDRLGAVTLLSKIFSEKGSKIQATCYPLWLAFLGRFNDISVAIRSHCVQHSVALLLHHPGTRKDIEENLCKRLHDSDERVRLEVVKTIVSTAKSGGFEYISGRRQLLDCVKERTMDKKPKIRHQALEGLAQIYKMHLESPKAGEERPPAWMHNRIMRGYYVDNVEDRTLIERLFNTCLVPYSLDVTERITQLIYLCSTAENETYKVFIEMQKNLALVRGHLKELMKIIRSPSSNKQNFLNNRISALAKFLPSPAHGSEFIPILVQDLEKSRSLQDAMKLIVNPASDCKTVVENVNNFLKKLDPALAGGLYYKTIKIILERASTVLVDKEAILVLLNLICDLVRTEDSSQIEAFRSKNFPVADVIIEKSCKLISTFAFLCPSHFDDGEVLETLINILLSDDLRKEPSSTILSAFVYIGKTTRPLDLHQPSLMETLITHSLSLVDTGSSRQAKMAVRCLHANISNESAKKNTFGKIFDIIDTNLKDPTLSSYATSVVALGHVALLMPHEFKPQLRILVKNHIVKGLLMSPRRTAKDATKNLNKDWCEEDALPQMTQCMIHGMKTLARWLLGLETDVEFALKSVKLLIAFVETAGSFCENQDAPFTNSEKAWIRLSAGCALLKLFQQKVVGDQYTASQFCSLAQLMNDDVDEVRFRFAAKLHKGLSKGFPDKCLPLDFMGFYAFAGLESDRKQKIALKRYMLVDVKIRREYMKMLMLNHPDKDKAADHLPYLIPDYMLAFAVPVLVNSPRFKSLENVDEWKDVKRCLQFILEPLVVKTDSYSVAFLMKLIQGIKKRRNTADLDNEEGHLKMYAVCDVAYELLREHDKFQKDESSTPIEPKIPILFYS